MKKHFLQFHPKLRDFLRISIIAAFALIIVGVFQIKAKAYFVCDIHSPKWVITKAPTCTQPGTREQVCQRCREVLKTETISATGHKWTWEDHKPTCTEDGVRIGTCKWCKNIKTIALGDALGHSYSAWTTVTPATCTSKGTQKRTCTRCNIVATRTISATGHKWTWEDHKPTCTEAGVRIGTCTNCGETKTIDLGDALGHQFDATGKCTRCGEYDSDVIGMSRYKMDLLLHDCYESLNKIGYNSAEMDEYGNIIYMSINKAEYYFDESFMPFCIGQIYIKNDSEDASDVYILTPSITPGGAHYWDVAKIRVLAFTADNSIVRFKFTLDESLRFRLDPYNLNDNGTGAGTYRLTLCESEQIIKPEVVTGFEMEASDNEKVNEIRFMEEGWEGKGSQSGTICSTAAYVGFALWSHYQGDPVGFTTSLLSVVSDLIERLGSTGYYSYDTYTGCTTYYKDEGHNKIGVHHVVAQASENNGQALTFKGDWVWWDFHVVGDAMATYKYWSIPVEN